MNRKRQKNQLELASTETRGGEAALPLSGGTELSAAKRTPENPATVELLMEKVCQVKNLTEALKRVRANKGSPGVDGMTVDEITDYLRKHWRTHREQLLAGTYRPQPVKRVEIPKPDGGVRKLGIPTVLDRFVQQAVLQVLQARWDPTFSERSYGFRPGRSAHQAVAQAQKYQAEGFRWVVDLDLEKFFDRVNHDKLMSRVAGRETDKRLLRLLRAFLQAGVLEEGLVNPTDEGTPQGGPLSPLLSNLVLDELDRELHRRNLRFVRYADDCNVYVASERAGKRVMEKLSGFITDKLKLRVNREKSAVARPWERKFLGFSFTNERAPRRRIAPKALLRFKEQIRELTRRTRSVSIEARIRKLNTYLRGWVGYFGYCETPSILRDLNSWIQRRLRSAIWKQWKRGSTRFAELRRRNVGKDLAAKTAGSAHDTWRLSSSPALTIAFPDACFNTLGLVRVAVHTVA